MGGKLYDLPRMPRGAYLEREREVRDALDARAGLAYRIPRFYGDKRDFGDMDVLVAASPDWAAQRAALFEALRITQVRAVGPVHSTVYRALQTDFFSVDPADLETTDAFMSFNDLGNFVGKLARRFDLKFGERGLVYVYRSADGHRRVDLVLSRDFARTCAFLDLDYDAWARGFETLEAVFTWVTASRYFSVAPYLDEPSHGAAGAMEKRKSERTTVRRFVEYLRARGLVQRPVFAPRERYLATVAGAFADAGLLEAIAREQAVDARKVARRERFNGARVGAMFPDLVGPALGAFIAAFKRTVPDFEAYVLAASDEALAHDLRAFRATLALETPERGATRGRSAARADETSATRPGSSVVSSRAMEGGDDPRKLRAMLNLNAAIDDLVEDALQRRLNLADTMASVLPCLCAHTGARGAFLRSFSESLELTVFRHPADLVIPREAEVLARTGDGGEPFIVREEGTLVVAQPLDVAGEWFGSAGLVLDEASDAAADAPHLAECLNVTCEELDNYLYAIRAARERHRVLMALGEALRHRVLGEGLAAAVKVLASAVPMERLLLVCVAEEGSTTALRVQVFKGGALEVDTMGATVPDDAEQIVSEGRAYLREGDTRLLARFGFERAQEEVLINGVTQSAVVGKVLVAADRGSFNTYDRELLSGFAGFIRQRVVDFNKEWRTLARSFSAHDVARMLDDGAYVERYLAPREAEVAMLYADISGFTRLSEQVLKTPSAVASLVEAWSREAVELVWSHGGVFDKMVGDCVIALFGPPFYRDEPGVRLARALECAAAIRAMTIALPERPGFEALRESGLAVSTGVNLAPLFVGRFGPNDNFTGFSSGMNNTARLQGCAGRNEILVMSDCVARLPSGHAFQFGEERDGKVKNVAAPLRFRALLVRV